ncbi:MAG: DNA mismatch repair protein MutS [Gammaproteobacteria bacterium]|nr:DNA mismatch repair protein MutS [Gammaproteobacteria bacterium]
MTYELKLLDFPQVQKLLATYACSVYGKEAAHALEPAPSLAVAQAMQNAISVARRLIEQDKEVDFPELHNIRPALRQADASGSVLKVSAFIHIRDTIVFATKLLEYARINSSILTETYNSQKIPESLLKRIDDILDGTRGIRIDASSTLRELDMEYQKMRQSVDEVLQQQINSLDRKACFDSGNVIHWQGERANLAVKPACVDKIKGVRRGSSGLASLQLVEPVAAIALNNQLEKIAGKIAIEHQRLLRELTNEVRQQINVLNQLIDAITWADLAIAGGKLSLAWNAIAPQLSEKPGLVLDSAYHPLLWTRYLQGQVDKPVALSLKLTDEKRLLLVTGPNTGGKTVALKTAGLLTTMSLSGLHIPAEGQCTIGWYQSVMVDMGDRQSLYHELSTFAGHVEAMIHILKHANENSLLLLDELGTGTDPDEGAALAMGLLDYLLRCKVQGIVNTHLTPLKSYANTQQAISNASMSFDMQHLSPTFQLIMGKSGQSMGLTIAERIGLDASVIQAARTYLKQLRKD